MDQAEDKVEQDSRRYGYLLDEYKEAGINLRHYGEVRFKQLAVFLSATAGLGTALYTKAVQDREVTKGVILVLGIVVVAAFFILEERATYYRRAYMYVLLGLERGLRFRQYSRTKNPWWLRSRYVYRTLFILIATAWIFLGVPLSVPGQRGAFIWVAALSFAVIVVNVALERYQRKAETCQLPPLFPEAPAMLKPEDKER